jgi:DNA invertase Pin-like site-specific DNA recombinase
MMIGYARVSTQGQDLDQQRGALSAAGCVRIFEEKVSGAKRNRPELARMLDYLQPGNVVAITRLDRLARSTADLLAIAERIKEAGAGLRSLAEPWADTTTPAGRMVLTVFAGMAEFERSLIVERTSAGRIAAKDRGVRFGPPPALSAEQIAHARQLIDREEKSVPEIARLLGVHRATLYRALAGSVPNRR